MIDKTLQPLKRQQHFTTKAKSISHKYDLWKALDFERHVKLLKDEDLGTDILKAYSTQMQIDTALLKNIQFKILKKSELFTNSKFNEVSKMQHNLWT